MTKNIPNENSSPIEWVKWDLQKTYEEYDVSDAIEGTYGHVFILKSNMSTRPTIAIKVALPANINVIDSSKDVDLFEREMNLSISLPPHFNNVPILGFQNPRLITLINNKIIPIPALKMGAMKGTLEDFIDCKFINDKTKLIAIIQAAHGLKHMYSHGFQGHGDIKPSNLLYSFIPEYDDDMSAETQLKEHISSSGSTFLHVVVTDYGWADAWIDLDEHMKVFREYMAPERKESSFIKEKSDIFSLGVVLAQLLLNRHPARNLKKAKKSLGNWIRCVDNKDWDLSGIESEEIKIHILSCLSNIGDDRPSIDEFIKKLTILLKDEYKYDFNKHYQQFLPKLENTLEHRIWAAHQAETLNDNEKEKSLSDLKNMLKREVVEDLESFHSWQKIVAAIIGFNNEQDDTYLKSLKNITKSYAKKILSDINEINLSRYLEPRMNSYPVFEEFGWILGRFAFITDSSFKKELKNNTLNTFSLSALAWRDAMDFRMEKNYIEMAYHFSESIRLNPNQATSYYWDVKSKRDANLFAKFTGENPIFEESHETQVSKLKKSIKHLPDWHEPKSLLKIIIQENE